MPKQFYFKTIHFVISTQFTSIWHIGRTLSAATTLGKSGPGSDGNKAVLYIPQGSSIIGFSTSDCLVSYPGNTFGESTPLQRCSWFILQPQPAGLPHWMMQRIKIWPDNQMVYAQTRICQKISMILWNTKCYCFQARRTNLVIVKKKKKKRCCFCVTEVKIKETGKIHQLVDLVW